MKDGILRVWWPWLENYLEFWKVWNL